MHLFLQEQNLFKVLSHGTIPLYMILKFYTRQIEVIL